MAKGSVRKKGKKWYFRFYVEDESGNRIQKEMAGTESKSETESMLRKAMEEYETQKFVAKASNVTLADMLDMWMDEELYPSKRSNGTARSYINTANRVKQHAIGKRKLKSITAEHMQKFFDALSSPQKLSDGTMSKGLSSGSLNVYAAVMRGAFRFAVFPKQLITFNPMQYVVVRSHNDGYEMFVADNEVQTENSVITHEQFLGIENYLRTRNIPSLLAFQIGYYTGLRIGEVCGIAWNDIDLEEQYLTVRRSMTYSNIRNGTVIGPTKRKKIRTVYFGNTLANILKQAKEQQEQNRITYGELYTQNYYTMEKVNNRIFYDVHTLPVDDKPNEKFQPMALVCVRHNGAFVSHRSVSDMCITLRKKVEGLDSFHFHKLRHTYSTRLISNGVAPKDVQELMGHSDLGTTMNIYTHGSSESKKNAVMLLDEVVI